MILIILLYALLASTFTLAKLSTVAGHPLFFISVRMLIAGTLLLMWRGLRHGVSISGNQQDFFDFFQVTLFHIYLSFVPEFWALQYLSSINVNIIYSLTPFIALILSCFLYKEKIAITRLLGMVLAFASLIPLFLLHACQPLCFAIPKLPDFVLLGAVVSSAYAWFIIKRLMNRGYSLLIINGVSMVGGGFLSALTYMAWPSTGVAVYNMPLFVFSLIALITISNFIVYNLYGALVHRYSVAYVATAGFSSPLFGAVYSYFFMNELLGWQHAIAMAGIAIGLAFFYKK